MDSCIYMRCMRRSGKTRKGLPPPIAPRRSLPANRAAQAHGLSPPIAPHRSLPANRAAQVSTRQSESPARRAGLRSLPANRAAVYGAINAMAAMDIVQD